VRTAKLAYETPHRLALGGGGEVELTSLGRRPGIVGFALSINCRFSAVHRGLFLTVNFYFVPVPLAAVPVVMAIALAMAVASVIFGIGISTRFLALRLGVMLTTVTLTSLLAGFFPPFTGSFGDVIASFDKGAGHRLTELIPGPSPVTYSEQLAFFDGRTQEPKIWFHQPERGGYELFDSPGSHPRYRSR
jgi:hypothetical protein